MIVARLATHKMEAEEDFDATRWLDRTLIRYVYCRFEVAWNAGPGFADCCLGTHVFNETNGERQTWTSATIVWPHSMCNETNLFGES